MNRCWITAALALAACQTGEPIGTGEVAQELNDCTPGGNYCGTAMPPAPFYQPGQQVPKADPAHSGFVVYQRSNGNWVAALANGSLGKVTWAVQVKDSDLGKLLDGISIAGAIDVVRPPPPPPPGGGTEASYVLEYNLRARELHFEAIAATSACEAAN